MFCTTVHGQARMGIAAQKNKRVGFIITQQDVIARLIELNIVVLKQQRFCLGMRDGDINIWMSATSASVLREARLLRK
jgi:hypothetical protein